MHRSENNIPQDMQCSARKAFGTEPQKADKGGKQEAGKLKQHKANIEKQRAGKGRNQKAFKV